MHQHIVYKRHAHFRHYSFLNLMRMHFVARFLFSISWAFENWLSFDKFQAERRKLYIIISDSVSNWCIVLNVPIHPYFLFLVVERSLCTSFDNWIRNVQNKQKWFAYLCRKLTRGSENVSPVLSSVAFRSFARLFVVCELVDGIVDVDTVVFRPSSA